MAERSERVSKGEEGTAGAETRTEDRAEATQQGTAASAGQQQQQIIVKDEQVQASYANFCRVSSTPEELVLDLGLNPHPFASGTTTIHVSQRVILNHFTAKRLLHALSMAVQRHEQAFGVLETDVRKRVRQQ